MTKSVRRVFRDQRGYTLMEMVVLMGIMIVLTGLMIANTKVGDKRQQLRDAAGGFVSAAKQAESLASGSTKVKDPGTGVETSRKAYGICLTDAATPACTVTGRANGYQIYARTGTTVDIATAPTASNVTIIATFLFPDKVELNATTPYIDYLPPAPTMKVNGGDTSLQLQFQYRKVSSDTVPDYFKTIQLNPGAGAVYVR